MDRHRLLKGLRIATSVVCLIVCVLLIVLWVRSYYRPDDFIDRRSRFIWLISQQGELHYLYVTSDKQAAGWTLPHWIVVLITTILALMPWVHWSGRFSLRTLLHLTTLVAVVLGLVVWSSGREVRRLYRSWC